MIDFENSIVMIGGVGAGKSLTSRALHEKTGMPVITTDILKRCPKTIEEIDERAKREQQDIQHLEEEIANCRDPQEIAHLKKIINDKRNELRVLGEQKTLREKMPNLPNYFDYGYNGDVANYLQENFKDIAWHYYQKQFEQLMLEGICTHYDGAAILDLGGGMPISLDKDYAILHNQFTEIDANLYAQHFTHLDKVGFDHVKNVISRFQHVNYLKLPEDFSQHGNRAMHDGLNPIFLSTHQFDELAKHTIDVSHLFKGGQLDRDELNRLTDTIINFALNSATPSLAD